LYFVSKESLDNTDLGKGDGLSLLKIYPSPQQKGRMHVKKKAAMFQQF